MRPIMDLAISALLRALDAPTGENAGDLDHVALVVAAVHAERMELEQLTGVVLVDPPRRALAHGVRRDPIARRGDKGGRRPNKGRAWSRNACGGVAPGGALPPLSREKRI